ncbi:MAG TPA: glycosyltransferase [Micromonosporaceae bacterium]|nr:glycosyltransferase [Micromonosporaceae bacterium]
MSILGWQSTEASRHDGCAVHPMRRFRFGSDALYSYLLERRPDAVVVLGDIWWLPSVTPPWVRRHLAMTGTPLVLHFPVDGVRADGLLPPSWVELLSHADVAVAMSRYGQAVASSCGIPTRYIPHGVDVNLFRPPPDRAETKRGTGVADRFVVLSDSRNQPRKMLPRLLDIFALFVAGHPQALLHLHTDPDDARHTNSYSYDLRADLRHRGLSGQVRLTGGFQMRRGRGLPLSQLAALYQAADVHLLASTGEGFGLPNVQAAAAGAVPLAGAHSACQELVEGHGQAITVADWVEDEFGIRRALVDVEDAAKRLAGYYDDADRLRQDAQRSRAFALSYGWNGVVEAWDALLRSLPDQPRHPRRLGHRIQATVTVATPGPGGASVTATLRAFDHVEAKLAADAAAGHEVRLPASPRPGRVGGEPRPRRPGLVGVPTPDLPVFRALQEIFPILQAWSSASWSATAPSTAALSTAALSSPAVMGSCGGRPWQLSLAESIMLMNLGAGLPDNVLIAAAVLGVPCLGTRDSVLQATLWPDLSLASPVDPVDRGRALLTNASFLDAVTARAERTCMEVVEPPLWRPFAAFRDHPAGPDLTTEAH